MMNMKYLFERLVDCISTKSSYYIEYCVDYIIHVLILESLQEVIGTENKYDFFVFVHRHIHSIIGRLVKNSCLGRKR